jgi:hypothetical protein
MIARAAVPTGHFAMSLRAEPCAVRGRVTKDMSALIARLQQNDATKPHTTVDAQQQDAAQSSVSRHPNFSTLRTKPGSTIDPKPWNRNDAAEATGNDNDGGPWSEAKPHASGEAGRPRR